MDSDLGRFVADKHFPDSFEGKAQWNGHEITIRLSVETDNERKCTLGALAVSAKTLLAQAEQWDAAAKEKIIEKLYALWKTGARTTRTEILTAMNFMPKCSWPASAYMTANILKWNMRTGICFRVNGSWLSERSQTGLRTPVSLEE
tara:strand:- start:38973 stop:39410 length:438 start_codon:yes stop_codon:yes gene_type:complete